MLTPESLEAFITSGDSTRFRSPYMRIDGTDVDTINAHLNISERAKARFLLACIRHSWETHIRYDVESTVPGDMHALIGDLLDARYLPLADVRARIDVFQHVFDHVQEEARANVADAIPAANVLYVTGALIAWLYHALVALDQEPDLVWFGYVMGNDAWLPFWLVLDGTASVGGQEGDFVAEERSWQGTTISGI